MLKSKYITPNDYLNYFGESLDAILPNDDMPSGKAERFIARIEDDVASILDEACFKRINEEYGSFSEYQKECYKLALLWQCKYTIKNGDVGNDSGYDPTTGKVISREELKGIQLSPRAIRYLNLCGLWNRNVSGKLGGGMFFPFIR